VICGNINNKKDIATLSDFKFDYIFHQAAISDTRAYNQELVFQTNINSFYDFIQIAKKNKSILIYASSAATYGSLPSPQKIGVESPENPYGYSKFAMDQIAYRFRNDIQVIGLRYFNVYGNKEFYKGKTSSMVIQLGHQILSNKPPKLFKGSDKIFRDFIFIDDVIQANLKACQSKSNGVFNVGTGLPRSFQDIADLLQLELGTEMETDYFLNPYEGYQMHTQADITLTKEKLGFKPIITLESGIKTYIPEIKRIHKSLEHD
jgi:ADP-L-glycero-D-manno-heptose 6-epimerase